MHDAATIRYPFLTLGQAAFFLQVSVATATSMYETGKLPKAVRLDGGVFEPVPGRRLIPYFELRNMLKGEALAAIELWQEGRLEVPRPEAWNRSPQPFRIKSAEQRSP